MPMHTPLQLDLHEYQVKNTLKRWLKTNPDSSQDQQSSWKLQKADKTCWTDGKTPPSLLQCGNKPYWCCGYSQGLVSRCGITVLRITRNPYQAMLSPSRRARGSMGCLGRWSAIKSWANDHGNGKNYHPRATQLTQRSWETARSKEDCKWPTFLWNNETPRLATECNIPGDHNTAWFP